METKAQLNNLRMAPRKLRLMVDLVRGMNAQEAAEQLQFSKKHAALPLRKLIASAIANAVNNHNMMPETLVIREALVNQGSMLKRYAPHAMGRATPIRKRLCHVTIVLGGREAKKKK